MAALKAGTHLGVIGDRDPSDESTLNITLAQLCFACAQTAMNVMTESLMSGNPSFLLSAHARSDFAALWVESWMQKWSVPESRWNEIVGRLSRESAEKIYGHKDGDK